MSLRNDHLCEKASCQLLPSNLALRGAMGQCVSDYQAELRSFGFGELWGAIAVCGHAVHAGGFHRHVVLQAKRDRHF